MSIYQFRNCTLNTREHSICVGEEIINLTSKTFDVLELLVKRAGKTVTKDQILEVVWKNSIVEEGNVTIHISRIRKLLEQKLAGGSKIIETVHGAGYRFLPLVQKIDKPSLKKEIPRNSDTDTISFGQIRVPDGHLIINIEVIETNR